MADLRALEDLILPPLTDRLETALELVAGADAMDRLEVVAALCSDAQALAAAGRLLRGES